MDTFLSGRSKVSYGNCGCDPETRSAGYFRKFRKGLDHTLPTDLKGSCLARALLGGIKGTLEIYSRVDAVTKNYPRSQPTTEEVWHCRAESWR